MRLQARPVGLALLLLLTAFLGRPAATEATTYPTGFGHDVIAGGLGDPTVLAFFPDGRILIGEKTGTVKLIKNGVLQQTPFINIGDRINASFDQGLIGLAVDKDFPAQPFVYLFYVYENDPVAWDQPKTIRLTRVTVAGDTADPNSEVVILGTQAGVPCNLLPAGADCMASDWGSHSAGNVKFASDGSIYVTVGDGGNFSIVHPDSFRSQNLDLLNGKILRITRAGKGLSTNPFWTGDQDANRSKVWAYGLRNAYRINLRPGSEVPYVGDVGWGNWEEISVAPAGSNLGWPCYEGSGQQGGYAPDAICQALYAGLPPPAPSLASVGAIIAKVPASLGSGGGADVIRNGDKPPPGSGDSTRQYDSWDGDNPASEDWIGYTFASPHTFDRVVFQEGMHFGDGGWFNTLTVQVRQNGQWVNVPGLTVTPAYPGNNGLSFETFTLTFNQIQGDGIRLYGAPGGTAAFISVGELEVFGPNGGGGGGGGGGGQPVETLVTGQAQTVIAKVPVPLGSGGGLDVIRNGDKPPPGSGDTSRQYDSWDGDNPATEDWVGYEFAVPQTFTRLVFQEGVHFWDGGWFNTLTVQVRQNGQWVNVSGLTVTPAYPGSNGVSFETFTLAFSQIQGDGIRLYGAPGGVGAFISVGELDVFALVAAPSLPPPPPTTVARPPLFEYPHNGVSAAVTAGAFYTGTAYPAQYQGAYFFGDFSQGVLRTLRVDASDALVPGSVTGFAQSADGPVDIEMGPDGLLYYVAIGAGELRRIRYTAGNTPPVAVAAASPTAGVAPLAVQFSSAGSNDPDGDPITFDWDFGDGGVGTGPAPQHTYQTSSGVLVATLTVRDNHGGVATDTVTITIGNLPPIAAIASPAATFQYKVGDVIAYSGSATSSPPDPLPGATLTWQILLHHCPGGACHTHPYWSSTGGAGSFTVPNHGDDVYFELLLTATDGGGLSHTVSRTIQPMPVQITLATVPTGLQVVYDGTAGTSPLVRTSVAGSTHTITASSQGANTFSSWSDGGAAQHDVTVGVSNVTYTATFSSSTCLPGQFRAEYFNNPTLSGTPVFTRCETTINYNWGTGGPGNGLPNDNFSVRWTGRFTFAAGSWRFTTVSDDGVRLWVDNVLLIDRWTDHGPTTDTATQTLTAGDHDVKVEYYDRVAGAVIQVTSVLVPSGSCPVGQFRAEYFNNPTLSGTPVFTRCETTINYNWGTGGPGNGLPNDNFSVRWTGRFTFAAGSWRFTTVSDDGVRLWVDNVLLIDRWTDHGPTTDTATQTLTAGDHDVKVEYYERVTGAVIQVTNVLVPSGSCPVGQFRAEYFNGVTLSGTPVFTRCETTINYNWGTGGPGNGIPNDNFSVRWTGRFTFSAGSKTFSTVSDDGVRLSVDNVLVINRWTDHGPTTDRVTRSMTAGDHDVKVEYYERGGGAVIQASW